MSRAVMHEMLRLMDSAITALKQALAEPDQVGSNNPETTEGEN